MIRYNIGDIVKMRGNSLLYFIVVDTMDFALAGSNDSDVDYEMMQIFPVTKRAKYLTTNHSNLELYAKYNSKENELFLEYIRKARNNVGLNGVNDFIKTINENNRMKQTKLMIIDKSDVIRYDKISSIDEGLRAISDLNTLHEMYGDESYIQLKELVIERLKVLA